MIFTGLIYLNSTIYPDSQHHLPKLGLGFLVPRFDGPVSKKRLRGFNWVKNREEEMHERLKSDGIWLSKKCRGDGIAEKGIIDPLMRPVERGQRELLTQHVAPQFNSRG